MASSRSIKSGSLSRLHLLLKKMWEIFSSSWLKKICTHRKIFSSSWLKIIFTHRNQVLSVCAYFFFCFFQHLKKKSALLFLAEYLRNCVNLLGMQGLFRTCRFRDRLSFNIHGMLGRKICDTTARPLYEVWFWTPCAASGGDRKIIKKISGASGPPFSGRLQRPKWF